MTTPHAMRCAGVLLLLSASLAVSGVGSGAAAPPVPPPKTRSDARARVALTFDDLPAHGPLPPGTSRGDIARSIVATLRSAKAPPTYGFVNAKALRDAPEAAEFLRVWRDAGHPLGSHTFSHMDLHSNTVEAFEQDVLADEPALRSAMGQDDWHWFRYPYLREGDTIGKRHAIAGFLKDHGYKVAEVTLSFDDYAYNGPYARCRARGDTPALEWLEESYLGRAAASLSRGQEDARRIYGRDIRHVLLLHVGAFQIVMLPRLLDELDRRGFKLVTLPEAQSDPAYAMDADVTTTAGATLLERMMAARGIAPSPSSDDTFARLDALCR